MWEVIPLIFKKGSGWTACHDEENGRYFGEYGGIQSYHLYELTEDQFNQLERYKFELTDMIPEKKAIYIVFLKKSFLGHYRLWN